MLTSPFEQFTLFFFYNSIYFNTITFIIILISFIFFFLHLTVFIGKNNDSLSFLFLKGIYKFYLETIYSVLDSKGLKFLPFICFLFSFILFSNLIGFLPYSFASTSQLGFTFALSFVVWYGVLYYCIHVLSSDFILIFLPHGVDFFFAVFIMGIELFSYFFRFISLALRLFANIVAGHLLLDIISIMVYKLYVFFFFHINIFSVLVFIPSFLILILLICFEFFVCIVQAYIFVLLCCIYLEDVSGH